MSKDRASTEQVSALRERAQELRGDARLFANFSMVATPLTVVAALREVHSTASNPGGLAMVIALGGVAARTALGGINATTEATALETQAAIYEAATLNQGELSEQVQAPAQDNEPSSES